MALGSGCVHVLYLGTLALTCANFLHPRLPLAPPHFLIQRLDMNDPGFWEKVLGAKPAQRLLNDLTQGKLDGAKAEAIEVYITGG